MGPLIVFTTVFCVAWAIIYVSMRLACWLKKEYHSVENWFIQFILAIIFFFGCQECRESCENHKKLIARSIAFALLVTVLATLIRYLR